MSTVPLAQRIAGAPISWGVCEAPDWGIDLPADRVLTELADLGLRHTELGPTGYLGAEPAAVSQLLADRGLGLIGGFLPVVMHTDPDIDLAEATDAIATLAAAGSEVVVLAARSADGSYDHEVTLTEEQWPILRRNLERLRTIADEHGLRSALHPHVGTAIESQPAVRRLLVESDIDLCLDTGHLMIGGTDPLELLDHAADRVTHVHLKDVRAELATAVADGDLTYLDAVRAGLYTPLGDGDLDIAAIVGRLESAGYQGWYVLEQDCALAEVPAAGTGPRDDVARSIDFLRRIDSSGPERVRA